MKNIKLTYLSLLLVGLLFATSCSEDIMDDINKDENHPSNVPSALIMTDIMTSSAFSSLGGTVSLYSSIYIEHEAGVQQQGYEAEARIGAPTASTTNNNDYNSIYENIRNLKTVIKATSKGGWEEGNNITLGIAKLLLAYNAAILTDMFGDAPFSEAGEMDENGQPIYPQPKIDKQKDIYGIIMSNLNEAILLLDKKDKTPLKKQDLIYGGDASKWKKAAYGLKARYLMRTIARSENKEKDLEQIIQSIDKSFTSSTEQLMFDHYNGVSIQNPLSAIFYSRDLLGGSLSFIKKLIERDDPRLPMLFVDNYKKQEGEWKGKALTDTDIIKKSAFKNGDGEMKAYFYPISFTNAAHTTPTILLSYHELLFLKAEALARLNKISDAESILKQAIEVTFSHFENTINNGREKLEYEKIQLNKKDADTYFDSTVKEMFNINALKEIMIQKYLAFHGASGESAEAYNDYRRMQALGENFIVLSNPKNSSKFPYRFPYGASDVTANQNIKSIFGDGSYVYKEKVWWAGGK